MINVSIVCLTLASKKVKKCKIRECGTSFTQLVVFRGGFGGVRLIIFGL